MRSEHHEPAKAHRQRRPNAKTKNHIARIGRAGRFAALALALRRNNVQVYSRPVEGRSQCSFRPGVCRSVRVDARQCHDRDARRACVSGASAVARTRRAFGPGSWLERCPSGLRYMLGKHVYGNTYRGFESPPLRSFLNECRKRLSQQRFRAGRLATSGRLSPNCPHAVESTGGSVPVDSVPNSSGKKAYHASHRQVSRFSSRLLTNHPGCRPSGSVERPRD